MLVNNKLVIFEVISFNFVEICVGFFTASATSVEQVA